MSNTQKKVEEKQGPHKFLEFTISGCYYNSKKETVDFDNVKGRIPYCDEESGIGSMHARDRFAAKWIKEAMDVNGDYKYQQRIDKIRQVHVDDVREVWDTLSFVGKDIKELSVDELQDLAVSKDLRFIPLPNSGMSKRDILIRAYVDYSEKILRKKVRWQQEDFNFARLPSIILDASGRTDDSGKISNEEMIEQEQKLSKTVAYGEKDDPRNRFTLEELKTIADSKNISYPDGVEFNDLYPVLFSAG